MTKQELRKYFSDWFNHDDIEFEEFFNGLWEKLANQLEPEVNAVACEDWISVKDILPVDKKHVIGYIEDAGTIVQCSKILTTDDELWEYVTYWMSTPSKPTG